MEEKILLKLEQMERKIEEQSQILQNFEEMLEEKLEKKLEEKLDKKLEEKLEEKLDKKLDEKLRKEFMKQNEKIQESVRKQILDHMFIFEEQYGRKLTIAFEALTSKYANEEIQDEEIEDLKRTSRLNTAYVYNHEDRLDKLEVAQI